MSQSTKELNHHKFYPTYNLFSGGRINGAAISKDTECLQIGTSQEKKKALPKESDEAVPITISS